VLHLSCCAWNADNDREPGELMGGYRADDVYELLARGDRRLVKGWKKDCSALLLVACFDLLWKAPYQQICGKELLAL
jgi:hypothetical protein